MRLAPRMPRWSQPLLSAALIAVVFSAMWYLSSRNRARWDREASVNAQDDYIDELGTGEEEQTEISTMPSIVETEILLRLLQESRGALLREAASGNTDSVASAAEEYQQMIHAVRTNLVTLQSRTTPAEYNWFLTEGIGQFVDDQASLMQLPEQALNILPQGDR